ncbi:MAG: hypothetical protein CSYNP_03096 [Syntrophus sp. SKADARSKE-3]|nr:hypothetical protein [Syntrophus sp. SKADARSKE-3]
MQQAALKLVYVRPANKKQEITTEDLIAFLKGKRLRLQCGHWHTQHNLSNTLVLTADGQSLCHS